MKLLRQQQLVAIHNAVSAAIIIDGYIINALTYLDFAVLPGVALACRGLTYILFRATGAAGVTASM